MKGTRRPASDQTLKPMDDATRKLFTVVKNLYDVVGFQQQQMDLLATLLGLDPNATPANPVVDRAKSQIAELEKLFNQPADEKEKS